MYNKVEHYESRKYEVMPHTHIQRLVNSSYFRLRVGEYRVILDVKESKLVRLVIEMGHRKNIYREL